MNDKGERNVAGFFDILSGVSRYISRKQLGVGPELLEASNLPLFGGQPGQVRMVEPSVDVLHLLGPLVGPFDGIVGRPILFVGSTL